MINNKFKNLDLKISKSEYWDFILNNDKNDELIFDGSFFYDDTIISLIDINKNECVSGDTLFSSYDYNWSESINSGLTLTNFGFNGIDNGGILFDKNNITNVEFVDIVTGTTFTINSGDTRLMLKTISGSTGDYIYPFSFHSDINGKYINLEGGFYQGFFKSGDNYSVLPSVIEDEMLFEFILKPDIITPPIDKTLNYKYPENKGIFFYLGVRSENKFWYDYFKNDYVRYGISKTGQTTPVDGVDLYTSDGFNIDTQNVYDIITNNKYLLLNRGKNGLIASDFDENVEYHVTGITNENLNYYQILNRTKTGYTASDIPFLTGLTKPYNIIDDVVGNSIAFRIKDDGSIGYRTIIRNCTGDTDGYIIQEEYSSQDIIKNNEITFVSVRLVMSENSKYGKNRNFKIMFYINGKLVFISKYLPELILRSLSDTNEKQESIPYNISIGGGSQGLCDMIGFSDNFETQYLLPIEKYFGGSFIGSIFQFKIYYGKTDYSKINNNFKYQVNQIFNPDYIVPTINLFVSGSTIQYPETHDKREIGNLSTILSGNIHVNEPHYPITGYKLYYYLFGEQKNEINGLFNIPGTGGTISEYVHYEPSLSVSGLTELKYSIEVFDTYNNYYGTEIFKNITFDNMIFYGNTNSEMNDGSDVRNLQNKLFNLNTNSFVLETGSINNIFVIAIPENREIISVIDQMTFMLDITNFFTKTQMDIPDAGGKLTSYDIYTMKNSIPYSRNHNFLITLN